MRIVEQSELDAAGCKALNADVVNPLFEKYEITTTNRIAGFLAQCGHESLNFTRKEENLNYSVAGLKKHFGKYFKTDDEALSYARNPQKIASRVYGNRMGNGDEASGEGWKFRGRGYIQLTGKRNYEGFAKAIGKTLEEAVAYAETDEGALESALYYWDREKLNKHCDNDDILTMTKAINGGTNGFEDRKSRYEKCKKIFV